MVAGFGAVRCGSSMRTACAVMRILTGERSRMSVMFVRKLSTIRRSEYTFEYSRSSGKFYRGEKRLNVVRIKIGASHKRNVLGSS
jgi:hypothetical protein